MFFCPQAKIVSQVHALAQTYGNAEIAYQLKRSHPALNDLELSEHDIVFLR